ncbi:MAG TPA: heparinase [Rheinheimera sp.]|nr:heparinase [Rheinheimera sp.]
MSLSSIIYKFSLYIHTLKFLRTEQFKYRILRKLFRPVVSERISEVKTLSWVYDKGEVFNQSLLGPFKVRYLNVVADINAPTSWNNPQFEKLWLYNLHYFDDLNAVDNALRTDWHVALVQRWIAENPPVAGNGWEPYPLSLRLVNWVKWFNRTGQTDPQIIASIAQQAQALSQQLEYHILGNHLFANGKALVFVGAFLQGKEAEQWLKLGLDILNREIPEQFLADGGHFELSPMYHCILLWDLLELIQLAELAKLPQLEAVVSGWREVAVRALHWLSVMIHPDGEVSFFNDSAMGIAASPQQIFQFAADLGLSHTTQQQPLTTLTTSGYSRLQQGANTVLFDHAAVGPDYLPGHAHADTLSIEWSIGLQRVLVNSGTSIYGVSQERLRQRQTAAHNTVIVDQQDSSEVWSGFRVARRAYAQLLDGKTLEQRCMVKASHNGYQRLKGKVSHIRQVELSASELVIEDELTGQWQQAQAMFHLHPDVIVQQQGSQVRLRLPDGQQLLVVTAGTVQVAKTTWHPGFGQTVATHKVIVPFHAAKQRVCFQILQDQ